MVEPSTVYHIELVKGQEEVSAITEGAMEIGVGEEVFVITEVIIITGVGDGVEVSATTEITIIIGVEGSAIIEITTIIGVGAEVLDLVVC